MSYLHCHNCNFMQDAFWSLEGWNPVKAVDNWRNDLFSEKIDKPFTEDAGYIKRNGDITLREVIARRFEHAAKNIRKMKYRTYKEFKEKNPEWVCPNCKQKTLAMCMRFLENLEE